MSEGAHTACVNGPFATWAARYQEAGLIVVPAAAADGKIPSVRWRNRRQPFSDRGLESIIAKFGHGNIGVLTGPSGLTIVDVDNPDLVATMIERCGDTPMITTTPRGGAHLWYRANHERSVVGLDHHKVDVRAHGGVSIEPPSLRLRDGIQYTWARGSLCDIQDLPKARPGSLPLVVEGTRDRAVRLNGPIATKVQRGTRNGTLFRRLLRTVQQCATVTDLGRVALDLNMTLFAEPLAASEVDGIVRSVWRYWKEGRVWAGGGAKQTYSLAELLSFGGASDALMLYMLLKAHHLGRRDSFAASPKSMANAQTIPTWCAKRYRRALGTLLETGHLRLVKKGGRRPGDPSLYEITPPANVP